MMFLFIFYLSANGTLWVVRRINGISNPSMANQQVSLIETWQQTKPTVSREICSPTKNQHLIPWIKNN